jgi:hypothetical protein
LSLSRLSKLRALLTDPGAVTAPCRRDPPEGSKATAADPARRKPVLPRPQLSRIGHAAV